MKKVVSSLLALALLFTLFACAAKEAADENTSPEASPAATTSVPPSADPSTAPSESAFIDVSAGENSVGLFSDGVDPQSRETYQIVYAYTISMMLSEMIYQSMQNLSEKLNISVTTTTGELDADKYITNIETLANQGKVDGFIAEIDPQVGDRINEVYQELGIPYIMLFNCIRDDTGKPVAPCVMLDNIQAGATTIQWLYDNYKTYWGDIDTSKIALLDFTFSPLLDLQQRSDGAIAKFKELYPSNTMFYTADAVNGTTDASTGYNEVAAIFAAHPEVEYWWIPCCLEMLAQGAARAAESLEKEDCVLIVDVGSDILCSEWDNSYNGCWVSCLAISNYLYVAPALSGLVALLDGKATPESLWSNRKADGDEYTRYYVSNEMVTKDTYKAYFADISSELALEG